MCEIQKLTNDDKTFYIFVITESLDTHTFCTYLVNSSTDSIQINNLQVLILQLFLIFILQIKFYGNKILHIELYNCKMQIKYSIADINSLDELLNLNIILLHNNII